MLGSTRSYLRYVWKLIAPYWKSSERWTAYALLAAVILLNLGEVYLNVLFNSWYNAFYNAMDKLDKVAFTHQLIRFSWLAAIFISIAVYRVYLNQMLSIRWRRWLTRTYLERWLRQQNYYHMQLTGKPTDNPDQRISEDISQFIDTSLGLSLGLLSAVVTLFSFLMILWTLSGPLALQVAGVNVYIPGYMVWAALLYALVGTWLTARIGHPLIQLNFNQQRFEADFRFSMVRLRENSENVAFYKGETQEQAGFISRFTVLFGNFWQIMKRQKKLTWFTSFYNQAALIFPFAVAAPRLFSKAINLGGVIQIANAFGQVQGALSYIVNSYTTIASWKATTDRLITFTEHMRESEEYAGFKPAYVPTHVMEAKNLAVYLPDGSPLLEHINLRWAQGDSVFITGPSGCGKTTLLRTLSGILPFASGELSIPETARVMFLPQRPYLPLGTLKQVLFYPFVVPESDTAAIEILRLCKLEHLCDRLHEGQHWAQILSQGEQQRIAFARAILAKLDFLFLDEATSAVDEALEHYLYGLLKAKCPQTCLVSVGHHATLKEWHAVELKCDAYTQHTSICGVLAPVR